MKSLVNGWSILLVVLTVLLLGSTVYYAAAAEPAGTHSEAGPHPGYLSDVACATAGKAADGADLKKNPEKHTVACMKMAPCAASGYGVLTKEKDGTYSFTKFDKKGNELAAELLKKTKKKDNLSVEVTGPIKDGVINVTGIVEK